MSKALFIEEFGESEVMQMAETQVPLANSHEVNNWIHYNQTLRGS